MIINVQAQQTKENLLNKTFSAKVGSIYEETPDDNPCAGQQVFLVLQFSEKKVEVIEKNISSCNKETIVYKLEYSWKLKGQEVVIFTKPEEVAYTYLEKLKLKLIAEKLLGTITYDNGKVIEHDFKQ